MMCINCKGEWTAPPGKTITECPFCKKTIEPTKTPETKENAKDVLCFIMQTYGEEALLTKNLFSDIAPNLSEERELIKLFREKGALDALKVALNSSAPEQSLAIKRAIGKLPSYLQNSPEAISLMSDFGTALGWNVPLSSVTNSIPPQMMNIVPLKQPSQATDPQKVNVIEVTPKIGSILWFGKYDWRVLDVRKRQVLLLSDKVIEKKGLCSSMNAITWAECDLRGYLNGTFYNSFGQDKSRISEASNNNPNNLWSNMNGGSATTDRIFLLSLEEIDKYFGNSGDYEKRRRKGWNSRDNKLSSTDDGYYISNSYDQLRIAKDSSGEACMWWLRSPGDDSNRAAIVTFDGTVCVCGLVVGTAYVGVRPALWLNL